MKAPEPPPTALVCDIHAAQAAPLAEIARALALDVGQPLVVQTHARAARISGESVLTLRLPAALASTQHQVWCLACRLACFCPGTRVSVLIESETAFHPTRRPRPSRAA